MYHDLELRHERADVGDVGVRLHHLDRHRRAALPRDDALGLGIEWIEREGPTRLLYILLHKCELFGVAL